MIVRKLSEAEAYEAPITGLQSLRVFGAEMGVRRRLSSHLHFLPGGRCPDASTAGEDYYVLAAS